ncbi:hypothetical protein EOD41_01750 [Mucilaginibacter limnophilus]|uniref:GP-PDE domain-containing protein n=1 Tax=Mucilaginibacter limnophilus TaxID=1932778 RepID=A0A437MYG2_9SPHI|nr:glycerophosphodiester phosphodiesterase family protein [Mucilaginibacter limnophilus]RVU02688.1 hypothetical protein EOD41_01750 [Mucilaginibacter limnophilus]
MRLFTGIALIATLMFNNEAKSQQKSLFLDNYKLAINGKDKLIAKIYSGGIAKGARLVEDTSGLFSVNKDGEVLLKNDAKPSAVKYNITIQYQDKKQEFVLVTDRFNYNKVVAHRGAWKNNAGSQNSLTSLRDAIRLGCEGSEFDVWLSKDGIPVLSHDDHIGGKKIEETPVAELQAIELKNGDHVPLFEEYIQEAIKQNTTHLVLELKPSGLGKQRGEELAEKCMDIIRKYKCQGWMLYISFDYNICKKIIELDPFAKVAYLNGDKSPVELKADKMWGLDYHFSVIDKDSNLINDAHKNGIDVDIWTVNEPEKMDAYLKAGADHITTNEPEILLEKVKGK